MSQWFDNPLLAGVAIGVLLVLACLLYLLILLRGWQRHSRLQGQDAGEALVDLGKGQQYLEKRLGELAVQYQQESGVTRERLVEGFASVTQSLIRELGEQRSYSERRQAENLQRLQEELRAGFTVVQRQVGDSLSRHAEAIGERLEQLNKTTEQRLHGITERVEQRLSDGFEKTTAVFADVLKRLALIDEAQKKITELSSNVVTLQEILSDKRSRGVFGEVQLNSLVRNVLPEHSFALQYSLPNTRVADCVLMLPEPTGMLAIDAKFPLESYQRMTDVTLPETDRARAQRQFKKDVLKHIHDIADRYIVPGTTADGAMMFVPAEAVFAEIQAHHGDLVDAANQSRVWMVSPTTLWAVLNTARAVLKDAALRDHVHVIRDHLGHLAKDFGRFQERMDNLARHIEQANADVQNVHRSARKITSRFAKIEDVRLGDSEESDKIEDASGN